MAIAITPLSDAIGAEISGFDLSAAADPADTESLDRALADHAVLVFREQALEPEQFLAAGRCFGTPMRQHLNQFNLPDCPDVSTISNQEKTEDGKVNVRGVSWHTDHSFEPAPPKATMLYAVSLPDRGGDTNWAHMAAAYEALPEDLREEIGDLQAVHAYTESRMPPSLEERIADGTDDVEDGVVHPLVRTHPDTGRKGLYINPLRVRRFVGMTPAQCSDLIDRLVRHATQPAFTYTHRWRLGDLVIWDNRSTIHKANTDYDFSQLRLMYRLIIEGTRPV